MQLVSDSPLRQYDPRLRLLLPLGASLLVMIPVARLALFFVLYGVLFQWARLAPIALRQLWRLKWWLLLIFVIDWLVVDLLLAVQVTLRVILLASAFIFMVYTTTPGELRLVLAWLRLPHRYAFSLSLAFQSVALFAQEWQLIQEAQRAWRLGTAHLAGLARPGPAGAAACGAGRARHCAHHQAGLDDD